jgi:hypothetical protein
MDKRSKQVKRGRSEGGENDSFDDRHSDGAFEAVKKLFGSARGKRKRRRLSDEEIFRKLRESTNFSSATVFQALAQVRAEFQCCSQHPPAVGDAQTAAGSHYDASDSSDQPANTKASMLDVGYGELEKRLNVHGEKSISLQNVVICGMSPLLFACSIYCEDLVLSILRPSVTGVNINETHDYGYTALHYAVESGMLKAVRRLVEAGANLEPETMDQQLQKGNVQCGGRRPLHFAARALGADGPLMIRALLEAGADPNCRDLNGSTPYILACMRLGVTSSSAEMLRLSMGRLAEEVPSGPWLQAKKIEDQRTANKRVQATWEVPEALREVFVIETILSADECTRAVRQVENFARVHGWLGDRHRGYATTDIRSAMISPVDSWLRPAIQKRLFPVLAKRFSFEISSFEFRDLFFVKYMAVAGKQSYVDVHRDGSILSFNILLNEETEFDGGGTWFEHTQRTHPNKRGNALVHSGKLRHAGTAITRGVRLILVGFIDAGVKASDRLELHFMDPS